MRAVGELRLNTAEAYNRYAIGWMHMGKARMIHYMADAEGMKNEVLKTDVYFTKRLLNKWYRQQLNPPRQEKARRQRQLREYYLRHIPEEAMRGGVLDNLNWLRDELYRRRLSHGLVYAQEDDMPEDDFPSQIRLDPSHLMHIRLSDRKQGGAVWTASDAQVLKVDWPHLLEGPRFVDVRGDFEAARDVVLKQAQEMGEVSFDAKNDLRNAVSNLKARFREVYRLDKNPNPPKPQEYAEAKGLLTSLEKEVARVLRTNDLPTLVGGRLFEGDRLMELIDHMGTKGVYFADKKPGDESTYEYLFFALMETWKHYMNEDLPPEIPKAPGMMEGPPDRLYERPAGAGSTTVPSLETSPGAGGMGSGGMGAGDLGSGASGPTIQ